jgi:AAHS family 4-hydroxybenzoate transporter-like MFS transporter
MHLPITQLFYSASLLFVVAAVFSTVLAFLYRARFGAQHAAQAAAVEPIGRSLARDS